MKTAIYVRLSEDRDGTKGGVARQEEDCRKLAKARGWDVFDVYSDDDVSATNARQRPEWERLLRDLEAGNFEAVIAYTSSRMYRRMADLLRFIEVVKVRGTTIDTVASGGLDLTTADGRMMAGILASIDQGEAERISERIRRKEAQRAEEGKPHGGGKRPFGYDWPRDSSGNVIPGGAYLIQEGEARVIKRATEHILRGGSLTSFVAMINDEGIVTSQGRRWTASNFSLVLKSPVIVGIREHHGVRTQGTWEPIISVEDQEMMIRVLASNRPQNLGWSAPGRRAIYLLSGLAECGVCGARLYRDRASYKCKTSGGGRGCVSIKATDAELFVWQAAERLRRSPTGPGRARGTVEGSDRLRELTAEKVSLLERRDLITAQYATGDLDKRSYDVALQVIDAKVSKLDELARQVPADSGSKFRKFMGHDLPLEERREFLRDVAKSIVVNPWDGEERISIAWR